MLFTVTIDTAAISGTITTLGEDSRKHPFAFQRYHKPAFREATSTRFREPQYTYTKIPDIQYGKAKGFWTSYPMEDDNNYTKMIFKLLPKTMAPKKLDLFLDLYIPNDSMQSHPLFVLLHGGAFFFGDKGNRNMREWCEHFAKCGYVVASVNYRLGFAISKNSIQQCGYQAIQDAHAALRYMVAHAEEYRINPDYIFLAGTSAGSITALATTFMNNDNCPPFVAKNKLTRKCGLLHTSGNEYRNKVKIKALANMWGAVYDLHELDGQHVPVISFHGTNDQVVPFDHGFPFSGLKSNIGEKMFDEMYGSLAIHQYLDSLHVRNKFYPLEGCGHAPHQEKNGTLNEHYWFIQEKMQDFFYPELVSKIKLKHDDHDPQLYCLDDEQATHLSWQAEGGLILDIFDNSVRVVWLDDAPKHLLRASGFNTLGAPFKQEWKPC
jgi:poly(3-hydroxybutyrate) depolymerase